MVIPNSVRLTWNDRWKKRRCLRTHFRLVSYIRVTLVKVTNLAPFIIVWKGVAKHCGVLFKSLFINETRRCCVEDWCWCISNVRKSRMLSKLLEPLCWKLFYPPTTKMINDFVVSHRIWISITIYEVVYDIKDILRTITVTHLCA